MQMTIYQNVISHIKTGHGLITNTNLLVSHHIMDAGLGCRPHL